MKQRARELKRDTLALYLACRDRRVPWYAKALAGLVVAYALSPIDLIPDFIPVIGYLDDLLLVPAGILVARRLIPETLLAEHRAEADRRFSEGGRPVSVAGAVIVATAWLSGLALCWSGLCSSGWRNGRPGARETAPVAGRPTCRFSAARHACQAGN